MADISRIRQDMMPSPDAEDALERDDPDVLAQAKAKYTKVLDLLYPKPSMTDINDFYTSMHSLMLGWRNRVRKERERRYQEDKLPQKWQKDLKDGRRIFTRLTHNEIMRVVAAQTSNPPIVHIPPANDSPDALKASKHESRWCNQLLNYIERSSPMPKRRQWVDAQNEDGFAVWEWFLTSDYDDLDTEPKEIMDPKTQTYRMETPRETLKRSEQSLKGRRPFGIRYVDGLNAYVEEDEDGVCRALIVERKPKRRVLEAQLKRGRDPEEIAEMMAPDRSDGLAWPDDGDSGMGAGVPTVLTIRYYDRRWTAYIVDGAWIEEPTEHGLPGCPVFPGYGMITSSPNPEQRIQGVTWGMESMELAMNDLLTLVMDTMFRFSRPKFVIETPFEGSLVLKDNPTGARGNQKPEVFDLSGDGVRQLNPGQHIVNVLQNFQPFIQMPLLQTLMNIWGKNSRNPVSQGESPGASPAGYTVSALQVASEELYVDNLRNEEVTWGRVVDFTRAAIASTIRDTVYLTAKSGNGANATVKWLGLGPKDISDTPAIVFIDPDTPASKMAKRQSLIEGNVKGYIPRRVVQTEGYGIDDPDAVDNEIVVDEGKRSLAQWAIQDAQQRALMIRQQQQQPGPGTQPGGAPPGPEQVGPQANGAGMVGGMPAPTEPPTVGGAMSGASQVTGGGPELAAYARGGSSNGYIPPPVQQ